MMTGGEETALGDTIGTIATPVILAFIFGLLGDQQAALAFAFWAGVTAVLWGMAWIGYAGGRAAQRKRDWYERTGMNNG